MLEVKKIGKSFFVVCGKSKLGKFNTEAEAEKSKKDDFEMYCYWAGSAGVSIENTPVKVVVL
jgi:hypothetical protein